MSFGGVEIILLYFVIMFYVVVLEDVRCECGIIFGLFCLSVGFENLEEFIVDFNYVLKEVFNELFIELIKE